MNTSNRRLARADGGANVARLREVMGGTARLGADLRDQRLRQGLELADAAARLRIGTDYLGAMEEGRFDDLPGRVYAFGFLRSYAEYLGLDGDLFVERLRIEGGGPTGPTELSFPEPMAPPSLPTGRIIAVTLVIAVVVVLAWMRVQDGIMSISDPVEPVPAELAAVPEAAPPVEPAVAVPAEAVAVAPASPPVEAAPSVPAPEVTALPAAEAGLTYEPPVEAEPEPPAPPVTVLAAPEIVVTDGIEATPEVPTPSIAPTTTPTTTPATTPTTTDEATLVAPTDYVPTVYGRGNAGRVELRATEETWIQVTASDGAAVFTRVLRPGDAYRVPDRAGLSLRTGNAGGLEVVVDGAALGPLGGLGEIRRGIALDPDSLKAGTAGGG